MLWRLLRHDRRRWHTGDTWWKTRRRDSRGHACWHHMRRHSWIRHAGVGHTSRIRTRHVAGRCLIWMPGWIVQRRRWRHLRRMYTRLLKLRRPRWRWYNMLRLWLRQSRPSSDMRGWWHCRCCRAGCWRRKKGRRLLRRRLCSAIGSGRFWKRCVRASAAN